MEIPTWQQLWDMRDRRTDGWFLVERPWTNVALCAAYVLLVTKVGPRFMRDRPAYNLKYPIMAYNLGQVISCSYMIYVTCDAAWLRHYSWACQPLESGEKTVSWSLVTGNWIYFMLKYTEFADTFFFVAKKKFNQVSTLHVYHHAIMPVYAYMMVRWAAGGHEALGGIINTVVHIIMYSYYFLAGLGPKMQPYLWWKKYLTALQLTQFVFCFTHSLILVTGIVECDYPWQMSLISMAFLYVPLFMMFADFYLKSYCAKPRPSGPSAYGQKNVDAKKNA